MASGWCEEICSSGPLCLPLPNTCLRLSNLFTKHVLPKVNFFYFVLYYQFSWVVIFVLNTLKNVLLGFVIVNKEHFHFVTFCVASRILHLLTPQFQSNRQVLLSSVGVISVDAVATCIMLCRSARHLVSVVWWFDHVIHRDAVFGCGRVAVVLPTVEGRGHFLVVVPCKCMDCTEVALFHQGT